MLLKAQIYKAKQTNRMLQFDEIEPFAVGVVIVLFVLPFPLQKRCAPATVESTLINPPHLQVQSQLGSLSSYMVPPPARGICQGLDGEGVDLACCMWLGAE